jgi:RNA polymerase sigma factor (sigma-70 family)
VAASLSVNVGIVSAVDDVDTAAPGNWAPTNRQVRASAGVHPDMDLGQGAKEGDTRLPADLLPRARAGGGDAFRELTEPHRRALLMHCYGMLGSLQDAEDALQDTLLAAWHGLAGFEGRASLRTWLYRIATTRCLNARRSASRRPAKEWDVPDYEPPEPTRLREVVWLEPYPDVLLEGAIHGPLGPEARYEQTEFISLAFVTALQDLPPRQLAVLVLRDVLGFHAKEVADMLDSTVDSGQQRPQTGAGQPATGTAVDRRPRTALRLRLTSRGGDRGEVRPRLRVRRSRRGGGPSER